MATAVERSLQEDEIEVLKCEHFPCAAQKLLGG